jgi:hypothetical protein
MKFRSEQEQHTETNERKMILKTFTLSTCKKKEKAEKRKRNTQMRNKQNTWGGGTDLKPIIGPRTKLHDTGLLVEGKVFDVNLTGGLVDGGRFPLHQPVVPQRRLRG